MLQTLHLARFQFTDVDIRRVGQTVDGGTSLSGISDTIEADGGGYWRADFTNGYTRSREDGLAWRQVTDLGLTTSVNVVLDAERLFGPGIVGHFAEMSVALTDGTEYTVSGDYTAGSSALRATTIYMAAAAGAKPILPGMLFSINHSLWGWRTYRVQARTANTVTITPPLRQAITSGTPADFDHPRCRMRLAQQPSNPTSLGRHGTCAVSFVEDMRQPQ